MATKAWDPKKDGPNLSKGPARRFGLVAVAEPEAPSPELARRCEVAAVIEGEVTLVGQVATGGLQRPVSDIILHQHVHKTG